MFKPKFTNLDAGFKPNFKQDGTSIDTNFDGYEVLKGEDGFSPIIESIKTEDGYELKITDKENTEIIEILNGKEGPEGPEGKEGIPGKDGAPGKDGKDGKDGYTPIKGKDYFTEEEVQEIVDKVVEEMPTPVTSWNDLTDKPFGETEVWIEKMKFPFKSSSTDSAGCTSATLSQDESFIPVVGTRYRFKVFDSFVSTKLLCEVEGIAYNDIANGICIGDYEAYISYSPIIKHLFLEFDGGDKPLGNLVNVVIYTSEPIVAILDEKFLPESVVLESELDAVVAESFEAIKELGYQTEDQVKTLINEALGVIENGTY